MGRIDKLVVYLPGRGGDPMGPCAYLTERLSKHNVGVIPMVPEREWYPIPRGASSQSKTTRYIQENIASFIQNVRDLADKYRINYNKVVLIGHSAGGVMALNFACNVQQQFAGAISISGALLTRGSQPAQSNMPVLITHTKDDEVFEWDERYLPTKEMMIALNHNLTCIENKSGGHHMTTAKLDEVVPYVFNYLNIQTEL